MFFQSIFILFVGIASLLIAGIPATAYVFHHTEQVLEKDCLWALAPLMGYGILTTVLKLLIKLDIPVKYSALPIFLLFLGIFILFFYQKRKVCSLRDLFPSGAFLITFLLVLALISYAYLKIGAKWYKGFAWWDCFFQGTQAEFLLTTPFSKLAKAAETKPYLGATYCYSLGAHRIARGAMQAFVAALTRVDGVSTLGFLGIIANLFVFFSLFFVTKDISMRKHLRYAGCAFAAVIPNVLLSHLECFSPVCMFCAFSILATKLFYEMFARPCLSKSLLVGVFVASVMTTLLDGIYLIMALAFLSFFMMLVSKGGKECLKSVIHFLIAFGSAWGWNLPYMSAIIRELSADMARQVLNNIYPFAYTPSVLNWAFWGSILEPSPIMNNYLHMILTFVAIVLLVTGLYALIYIFLHEHHPEGLTFCALAFSPLLFMIQEESYEYAFYKMFTFAIPLIAFGVWKFADLCLEELKCRSLTESEDQPGIFLKRFLKPSIYLILFSVFLFSAGNSLRKLNLVVAYQTRKIISSGSDRVDKLTLLYSPEMMETYQLLESMKDKNVLLMDQGNSGLDYWWMTYYGRSSTLFSLLKESDNTYFGTVEFERTDCEKIPLDAVIVQAPNTYNMIIDTEKQEDFAAILQQCGNRVMALGVPGISATDHQYGLYVFARYPASAEWVVTAQSAHTETSVHIGVQKNSYYLKPGETKELHFPINLSAGGQMISITCSDDVTLSDWRLEIAE